MLQLLFHLWGDYITQNHWMANKKVLRTDEGVLACTIHCILYSLPFLYFKPSASCFLVIFFTHYFIDHYRLAKYLVQVKNWCFNGSGFPDGTPAFLSVWLLFITDNILHVTINYLALKFL